MFGMLDRRFGEDAARPMVQSQLDVHNHGNGGTVERGLSKADEMAKIHYRIVLHDGGWAYKLGDVFSEPFASRSAALSAAKRVAAEQHIPGDTTHIEFQDEHGVWHTELSEGNDRPDADVVA